MVVLREDNRLGNFEDQQQQAPGANGQMNRDQQQQAPGVNGPMNQDQQRQALGANGQLDQPPGPMDQQQQQAGRINQPQQLGAGRGDDVPPQGVGAVSNCRLPPFWRTGPELWFFQIESQFQVHNVTSDSTRYHLVVAALDVEAIAEVSDIIRRPPVAEKYNTLKTALISRMTDSPEVQLHKLLTGVEFGDRRPSQLLRRMRTLAAPANVSDKVLRSRWLDLLPPQTRRLLLVIRNQSLEDLAAVADEAHEVGLSVMATSPSPRMSQSPSNQVAQELAQLRRAIEQLTTITRESIGSSSGQRGRSRSRGNRPARNRSPTPANNARTGYCWYHATHGDVADNCKPGCTHPLTKYPPSQSGN
uniref:DUF7041 domain-containing protein n=1 Tax=Trichogramma kaykai TaxID=54128 RepID=A0ABD2X5Q0_9HYME